MVDLSFAITVVVCTATNINAPFRAPYRDPEVATALGHFVTMSSFGAPVLDQSASHGLIDWIEVDVFSGLIRLLDGCQNFVLFNGDVAQSALIGDQRR
jgi:hypothetical protein